MQDIVFKNGQRETTYRKEQDMSEHFSERLRTKFVEKEMVHQQASQYSETDSVLCPLLPSVKRNKDNNLAMFLEGNTAENKTLFRASENKRPKEDEERFK